MSDIEVLLLTDDYVVINKAPDVRINSDDPDIKETVEHQLRARFPAYVDEKLVHSFRFCHRLDHATSGVLCVAFNKKSSALFSKCFQEHKATKHYLALLWGHVNPAENVHRLVTAAIGRDSSVTDHCRMCTPAIVTCTDPRPAQTTLHLLQYGRYGGKPASKLLLIPHTGRTHQLRVHCACIGHLIVGDYTYSNREDAEPARMMLHAYSLRLPIREHPEVQATTPDPFTTERDPNWIPDVTFAAYGDITANG